MSKYLGGDWIHFHDYWIYSEKTTHLERCFIFYEDLINNLTGELVRMSHFLGFEVTKDVLECIRKNSEGKFHRQRTKEIEQFFEKVVRGDLNQKMEEAYQKVKDIVRKKGLNSC